MIKHIELENVRNHAHTEVDLKKINLFLGRNGAGKSTIKNAIEVGLTGRSETLTDGKGQGLVNMIGEGGITRAKIALTMAAGITINREIPNALQIGDWAGGLKEQQQKLYAGTGTSEDIILAALNTSAFLGMAPADQKNLLFRLGGVEISAATVREAVTKYAEGRLGGDLLDGALKLLKLGGPEGEISGGPEVLADLYRDVYTDRTAAKKLAADLKARMGTATTAEVPPGDLKAVEKALSDLRAKQQDLTGKQEHSKARQELVADQRKKLQARIDELEGAFALESEDTPATDNLPALEQALAKIDQEIAGLQEQIKQAAVTETQAKMGLDIAGDRLERLGESEGKCPILPDVECKSLNFKELIDEYCRKADEARSALAVATAERETAEDCLQDAKRRLANVRQEIDTSKAAQADRERREALAAQSQEEISRLKAELKIISQPTTPVDYTAELQDLHTQIAEKDARRTAIIEHEAGRKTSEENAAAWKEAEQKVSALEFLCEALGPKGIRQQMLGDVLTRLEKIASEKLAAVSDYELLFSLDTDLQIEVRKGAKIRPVKALSASEQYRVGVALQYLLAHLAKFPLVVLDAFEQLDDFNREAVLLMLKAADVQSIILCVAGRTIPGHPGWDDLAMFKVEDGAVVSIVKEG